MSGSGGGRGDGDFGGGGDGQPDPCLTVRQGPINSPNPAILAALTVGSILDVWVDTSGSRPVLVVGVGGRAAGSLTFRGYLDVIGCITNHGIGYRAVIVRIAGGAYEVRVEPV